MTIFPHAEDCGRFMIILQESWREAIGGDQCSVCLSTGGWPVSMKRERVQAPSQQTDVRRFLKFHSSLCKRNGSQGVGYNLAARQVQWVMSTWHCSLQRTAIGLATKKGCSTRRGSEFAFCVGTRNPGFRSSCLCHKRQSCQCGIA
jgi:hypothetical protein